MAKLKILPPRTLPQSDRVFPSGYTGTSTARAFAATKVHKYARGFFGPIYLIKNCCSFSRVSKVTTPADGDNAPRGRPTPHKA